MENTKITESILNLTTTDTLKDLGFIQGNNSELYTQDGTKLTVRTDTNPTEYQKDDGSIIFATDIIASHYYVEKTDENIETIYNLFKPAFQQFSEKKTQNSRTSTQIGGR